MREDGAPVAGNSVQEHREVSDLVRSLVGMMQSAGLSRLDLQHGDLSVSLRRDSVGGVQRSTSAAEALDQLDTAEPTEADTAHVIAAPMIGTFYAAPSPSDPAFVAPGDRVEEGQTVGIIEAMKIMNEIAADRAGIVLDVVARNAQTVEYGSPLVRLLPLTD